MDEFEEDLREPSERARAQMRACLIDVFDKSRDVAHTLAMGVPAQKLARIGERLPDNYDDCDSGVPLTREAWMDARSETSALDELLDLARTLIGR